MCHWCYPSDSTLIMCVLVFFFIFKEFNLFSPLKIKKLFYTAFQNMHTNYFFIHSFI